MDSETLESPDVIALTSPRIGGVRSAVWITIALVACGNSQPPKPTRTVIAQPTADGDVVRVETSDMTTVTPPRRPPAVRPHGDLITAVAVTPEGDSAIAFDQLGGARLWPTLDGSLEPRVVELPRPRKLLAIRDPRGFAIALIDEAGALAIHTVDREGVTLGVSMTSTEPAIYQTVVATDRGVIALRADQRLRHYSVDGSLIGELTPASGERVIDVVGRNHRVLAIIEAGSDTSTTRRLRWVDHATMRWGRWVPKMVATAAAQVALSPSGTRVAMIGGTPTHAAIADVTTGDVVAEQDVPGDQIGFVTDDAAVASERGAQRWIGISGFKPPSYSLVRTSPLAFGGKRMIAGTHKSVAIGDVDRASYLGHRLSQPTMVAASPAGVIVASPAVAAPLDRNLADHGAPLIPPSGQRLRAVRSITDNQWLTLSGLDNGDDEVAVIDGTSSQREVAFRSRRRLEAISFEPSTRLLAAITGEATALMRLDGTRTTAVARVAATAGGLDRIFVVDPKRARGAVAVVVQRGSIRWVSDPAALEKGPSIPGAQLAAVGTNGTVGVWRTGPTSTIELYRADGVALGTLMMVGGGVLAIDPVSNDVVRSDRKQVTRVRPDGTVVWKAELSNIHSATWIADNAIVLVGSFAVFRVDADSGTVGAARCGFAFGLASEPLVATPRNTEPACGFP